MMKLLPAVLGPLALLALRLVVADESLLGADTSATGVASSTNVEVDVGVDADMPAAFAASDSYDDDDDDDDDNDNDNDDDDDDDNDKDDDDDNDNDNDDADAADPPAPIDDTDTDAPETIQLAQALLDADILDTFPVDSDSDSVSDLDYILGPSNTSSSSSSTTHLAKRAIPSAILVPFRDCATKTPPGLFAMVNFCRKLGRAPLVPSMTSAFGRYHRGTLVAVQGRCRPRQRVKREMCLARFLDVCVRGGKEGGGWEAKGAGGKKCLRYVIQSPAKGAPMAWKDFARKYSKIWGYP